MKLTERNNDLYKEADQLMTDIERRKHILENLTDYLEAEFEKVQKTKPFDDGRYQYLTGLLGKARIMINDTEKSYARVREIEHSFKRQRVFFNLLFWATRILVPALTVLYIWIELKFGRKLEFSGSTAQQFFNIQWLQILFNVLGFLLISAVISETLVMISASISINLKNSSRWDRMSKEIVKLVFGTLTIISIVVGFIFSLNEAQISIASAIFSFVIVIIVVMRKQFNKVVKLVIDLTFSSPLISLIRVNTVKIKRDGNAEDNEKQ